ncbi:glycosyltransferase family protein, partial [Thermoproteota archaeon]
NISVYRHGDSQFENVLGKCNGIISTAGHTLLSEAMYLGIPVYCIPLPVYEQHMNAKVIDDNKFGVLHSNVDEKKLNNFINNIPAYRKNIELDSNVLLPGPGQYKIIEKLDEIASRS